MAFENLEITEKCKNENRNTPISLDRPGGASSWCVGVEAGLSHRYKDLSCCGCVQYFML